MLSKNTVSVMRGAALWAATFASVVTVATIWSAAYVSFTTTDYAYPRTGGATNLNATMWNKLIDNVQDIGLRTSAITASSGSHIGIGTQSPTAKIHVSGSVSTGFGVLLDRYDTWNNNGSAFVARRAWGTAASPTAPAAGEDLGVFVSRGYGATAFNGGGAVVKGVAAQDFTDTAAGQHLDFMTNASWSVASTFRMRISSEWNVGIGTASPVFKLDVNGSANAASQCIGWSCLSAWSGIVGGSYTTATTKCAAVNNPVTWSTTCPSGFGPVITGRGLCDQSDPAFSITYLCVKN